MYTWSSTLCWSWAHSLCNWSWGDHHKESFFFGDGMGINTGIEIWDPRISSARTWLTFVQVSSDSANCVHTKSTICSFICAEHCLGIWDELIYNSVPLWFWLVFWFFSLSIHLAISPAFPIRHALALGSPPKQNHRNSPPPISHVPCSIVIILLPNTATVYAKVLCSSTTHRALRLVAWYFQADYELRDVLSIDERWYTHGRSKTWEVDIVALVPLKRWEIFKQHKKYPIFIVWLSTSHETTNKYMCQGLNSHYFHIIGDKLINPIP